MDYTTQYLLMPILYFKFRELDLLTNCLQNNHVSMTILAIFNELSHKVHAKCYVERERNGCDVICMRVGLLYDMA